MDRLGYKLRILRKRQGLTVRQLSKMLNINHSHITKLETGQSIPSLKLALKIADLFGVSVDQLARDELDLD